MIKREICVAFDQVTIVALCVSFSRNSVLFPGGLFTSKAPSTDRPRAFRTQNHPPRFDSLPGKSYVAYGYVISANVNSEWLSSQRLNRANWDLDRSNVFKLNRHANRQVDSTRNSLIFVLSIFILFNIKGLVRMQNQDSIIMTIFDFMNKLL